MFMGGFGGHDEDDEGDWQQQGEGQQAEEGEKKQVNTTQFYELLEITKEATTEQIKKAFRKKALKQHPDKGGDPDKFARLKEAYQILLDPEKRQLYDEYGEEGVKNGGPPGAGGGLFDFFNMGKSDNKPKKMRPKLIELKITLEDIYHGAMKQVTFKRLRICQECQGKGGKNVKKCEACKGQGATVKMMQVGPGMYTQAQVKCTSCQGKGQTMTEEDRCKTCLGKKVIEVEKVLEVAIEGGVPDSHDYIFTGESDEYPGVMAGDVYVRIAIQKHEIYERRGADLVIHKEISLLEALTGVTTTLKHLDGKQYLIATSPGDIIENKELKTLKKLGLPFYKDPMSYGNLYFEFKVKFPESRSFDSAKEAAIRKILSDPQNPALPFKIDPNEKSFELEAFSEELLNPKTGEEQQDEQEEGHQGQGVSCQQQ